MPRIRRQSGNRRHPRAARAFTLACLLLGSLAIAAGAELRVPAIVGDHMVLQRDMELPIWGWAEPGATVSVSIDGREVEGKADDKGRWEVTLAPLEVTPDALEMEIRSGGESLTLSDILVGEVWLCSGQSNMAWPLDKSYDADLEIATANHPGIRLIRVGGEGTQEPQDDFVGQWKVCTPETVANFSGVGYFFGRQIHQTLGVPVGLIKCAVSNSAAEAWVPRDALERAGRFQDYIDKRDEIEAEAEAEIAAAKAEGKEPPRRARNHLIGPHRPGNLWNGRLHPLIGYGIRGVIWYQGEANAGRFDQYHDLFSLLITQWREHWGQGDFPFYWVQLPDYGREADEPNGALSDLSVWARLREAQTRTLALPNTGQAVTYDLGEGSNIHPRDKHNVAKRLARIALARDYGHDIAHLSPSFESMEIADGKVVLTFKNVGGSLRTFDSKEVTGFALADEDGKWHWAEGEVLDKNRVGISSPDVPEPVAVRYAWAFNPVANLRNRENLPAVPFRTDNWPRGGGPQKE